MPEIEQAKKIVDALNRRMAIKPTDEQDERHLHFNVGAGGFTEVQLRSKDARAAMYTHGAHVTAFSRPGETPILWMSAASQFEDDKPIRGGIPICFPWFANNTLENAAETSPMHGFARTMNWKIRETKAIQDGVLISLVLDWSPRTRAHFDGAFEALYTVSLTDKLSLSLKVTNHGKLSFTFEAALHAYFNIADIDQTHIEGLSDIRYIDKVDALQEKKQKGTVTFEAETDRVYLNSPENLEIHDVGHHRIIEISKKNADTAIVWNPWIDKAKAIGDLNDNAWQQFMCLESGNAGPNRVTLAKGESHEMTCILG